MRNAKPALRFRLNSLPGQRKLTAGMPHPKPPTMPRLAALGPPPLERDGRVVAPKVVPVPPFGVVVFESRHGPGFVGQLQDKFSKFLLIVGGRANWEAKTKRITVTTDSLVHIPARLPHRQQDCAYDPVVLYAIHYRPTVLPASLRKELLAQDLIHWNLSAYLPLVARTFRSDFQEMLFEQDHRREGWEWMLCSRLVELAVRAVRMAHRDRQEPRPLFIKGSDSAQRVARYALHLKTHFYLRQSLDDAAAGLGLSRRRFTEMFRQVTGASWKQYIHNLRLEHGRRLLLQTDKTVTAAAFESGFEDLSHFNHAFKKAYGCAPQSLRQNRGQPARADPPGNRKA
jgi:AraC-like DNA-binding protein